MTLEQKIQIQRDIYRLFICETIEDSKDMLYILSDCLFRIMDEHANLKSIDNQVLETKLICQMLFTKTLYINKMLEAVEFASSTGMKLNKIIDPTVLGVVVRNIYETVGMFNLIFVKPKTPDEKTILYNLWVISGLKYRQKFSSRATKPESKQQIADEANDIIRLTNEIEKTVLYNSLDAKSQGVIKEKIKSKDFKIEFNNGAVRSLSWQNVTLNIEWWIIDEMYTFFSLYAHPSNISVRQFRDLFQINDPTFIRMSKFHLRYVVIITCVFIRDYIEIFPETLRFFESLPLISQLAINNRVKHGTVDKKEINNVLSLIV